MKKTLATGAGLLLWSITSMAQDAPNGFDHSISLGGTLTDGNSETLQANAALVTNGEKEGLGSLRAGVEANYGESAVDRQTETTVENIRVFANVKKTLRPRAFASLDGSWLHDSIAQVDYRAIVAPGLGLYLVKSDSASLFIEAGPAYLWEKMAGASDDYLVLRLAERLEHAFGPTAKMWQALEYLPKGDDFGDYLLHAELGVEAAVNASVNVRLALQNKYDSAPAMDLEKNDFSLIAGISVSL